MNEMKRPWDFWKSFLCAQISITVLYIFYGTLPFVSEFRNLKKKTAGLFVYSYQGQFAVLVSNQGISVYVLQAATNALSIVHP